jgi:hypothetical protein
MALASHARPQVPRSNVLTIVAIASTAYALCDLVHEVAGHGIAAVIIPGVRLVSLSTVALQTTGNSRAVAACGSIANVIVGAAAIAVFHRLTRFSTGAYFAWLFGSLNLLNGSGYPLYSAVLGAGDWDVVIRGLQPPWMWRIGLGIVGAAAYWRSIVLSAKELKRAVKRNLVSRAEIDRLVFPAYVAGGALLLVASAFNPIGSSLILSSGLSSGFAAMAGLTLVPGIVERQTDSGGTGSGFISRSPAWVALGIVVAVCFVAPLGPGIDLTR